jgi:hypothetical protein
LEPQARQQALEEALRRGGVPPLLHEDVQHHALLIDGAPEVVVNAVDAQEHLVEMPGVARLRPPATQPAGEVGAEPDGPLPDALVRDHDAPLRQDQLDIAQAQAEDVVEPYGMADHLGREPMAGVGGGVGRHATSLAEPRCSGYPAST